MKLAKFLLTPPIAAISVSLFLALGAQAADVTFTKADPIANLQTTIDGLSAGDRVILGDGLFEPDYTIQLTNGVSLVGSHYTNCVIRRIGTGTKRLVITVGNNALAARTVISNLTITGGYVTGGFSDGAGVSLAGGTISHCMLSNNVAAGRNEYGAAIKMSPNGSKVERRIEYCVICDNSAGVSGAGIGQYANPKTMTTVESCLVYGNKAESGAGIWNGMNGQLKIYNTTITANTATGAGGGVGTSNNTKLEVVNCIIADNVSGATYENKDWAAGTPTMARNNLFGKNSSTTAYGDGSVLGLADFREPSAFDFHLGNNTQAKGLAKADYPATDLDGVERTTPSAAGCYEFVASSEFGCSPDFTPQTAFYDLAIGFDAHPANEPEGKTLTYTWTLTDQFDKKVFLYGAAPTSTLARAGVFSVVLTVTDGEKQLFAKTCDSPLTLAARTNYVTCAASDQAAYPYETPATAATNINDALACTIIGSVVVLDEGTHALKEDVTVATGAEVRGAGIDRTVLDLGGSSPRVLTLNQAKAHLTGLTVCNGESRNNKGALVTISAGRMTDVRFTRLRIRQYPYSSSPVYISSGQVCDRCVFDHCTNDAYAVSSAWEQAHAAAVTLKSSSTLRNSLIHHNYSDGFGGTVAVGANTGGVGLLENCTVVDNVNAGVGIESAAVMVSTGGKVRNVLVARNSSPNWTPTGHDNSTSQPTGSAPNWVVRGSGTKQSDSYNNCWGESAETYGAACADGSKILFKDPANGNWRFGALSSCYDAGKLDATWMTGATDLDGNPRVFHRNRVDIGCYECQDTKGLMLLVK